MTTLNNDTSLQFAMFTVGDMLMGIDINKIQEINRHMEMTEVPGSNECVKGIINLRGDVVTVVDLRVIFGFEPSEISQTTSNIIINSNGEKVSMMVDSVADVVAASKENTEPPPSNLDGADEKYFESVYKMDSKLLMILNVDEVLNYDLENAKE